MDLADRATIGDLKTCMIIPTRGLQTAVTRGYATGVNNYVTWLHSSLGGLRIVHFIYSTVETIR